MKNIYITVIFLYFTIQSTTAQQSVPFDEAYRILNSHSTEEFNNQITSFVRVVADKVTSDESGYTLNLSLIAFKDSSKWMNDTDYIKKINRFLRYTQVSGGVNLKGTDVNDINSKLVFTMLNRRDSALYNLRNELTANAMTSILREGIREYKAKLIKDGKTPGEATIIADSAFLTINTFNNSRDEKDLDKDFLNYLNDATKRSTVFGGLTFAEALQGWKNNYDLFAKSVQRRPLWTLYPSVSYNYSNGAFNKAGIGSTLLVSLGRNVNKKPLEVELKTSFNAFDDTSSSEFRMDNNEFVISAGINKVFFEDLSSKPKLELKIAIEYNYNFDKDAAQKDPVINGVFKYKASDNFWIPLTISYDPEIGNLLGFISVTFNFDR